MGRKTNKTESIQYNVRVTKQMDESVREKMDILGYLNMTELMRELLRNWLAENR